MDGEFGGQPLAQQPGAAALGLVGRGSGRLGRVELGEDAAGEVGEGLGAGRGEVRESVVVGVEAEVDRGQRVEVGEGADVVVRDAAGGGAALAGVDQFFNHPDILSQPGAIASLSGQAPADHPAARTRRAGPGGGSGVVRVR